MTKVPISKIEFSHRGFYKPVSNKLRASSQPRNALKKKLRQSRLSRSRSLRLKNRHDYQSLGQQTAQDLYTKQDLPYYEEYPKFEVLIANADLPTDCAIKPQKHKNKKSDGSANPSSILFTKSSQPTFDVGFMTSENFRKKKMKQSIKSIMKECKRIESFTHVHKN